MLWGDAGEVLEVGGEVGLRWLSWGSPMLGMGFGVQAGANLISPRAASSQSLA